ncbi:hypothetical protein BKA93DRAFT_746968 [Sparassis latifolia]
MTWLDGIPRRARRILWPTNDPELEQAGPSRGRTRRQDSTDVLDDRIAHSLAWRLPDFRIMSTIYIVDLHEGDESDDINSTETRRISRYGSTPGYTRREGRAGDGRRVPMAYTLPTRMAGASRGAVRDQARRESESPIPAFEYDEGPVEHRDAVSFSYVQTRLQLTENIDIERIVVTSCGVVEVPGPMKDGWVFYFDEADLGTMVDSGIAG